MGNLENDPNTIRLSQDQREELATTANQAQKPWWDVFADALKQYRLESNGDHEKKTAFGIGKGVMTMSNDFEAPLGDFREYME